MQFSILRSLSLSSKTAVLCAFLALGTGFVCAQSINLGSLDQLTPGRTKTENALWYENPLSAQFVSSKTVVIADLKGPGVITMIHFALPDHLWLNRDVLLRMYWDGESSPSVDVPLVDFFADPDGLQQRINTALVNKRRGWNAYFPMPFSRSAKIELVYDGPLPPGKQLKSKTPCYSYVLWQSLKQAPSNTGYFHASWRQQTLLLGKQDYIALEAQGKGKFIGWNLTIHSPSGDAYYPVDENEKFYIDGETKPSVEFQGLEDSFGFSWGFPPSNNFFPLTGYFKFLNGAAAYRFFTQDAISFDKSLRVAIGPGAHESSEFRTLLSKPDSILQISSTVYWYQRDPHAPLPPMPPASEREPTSDR